MRRKRDSKRRWKARYLAGRVIPHIAVVEHSLTLTDPEYCPHLDAYRRRKPNVADTSTPR